MTRIVDVVVPHDHPALPGHFAGRPIVPAAWILTLVAAACRDRYVATEVRGVVHARFRAPLLPGMPLAIAFERADADRVAFRCTSGGTRIADGVLDA